jgi:heme/copper-type cytochrome/quinol oxidase subunit 2
MHFLMTNNTISKKVELAPNEGKSYARYDILENGTVVLGITKIRWWNQLIGCQFKLSFEGWALAVWDALVDLSSGHNAVALEEELSTEIAKKAQRKEDYEWVVKRLYDCYEHVTNGKGGASSAGDKDQKGSSMTENRTVVVNGEPVTININANNMRRSFRIPDSTGNAFLNFDLGVVGVHVDHD